MKILYITKFFHQNMVELKFYQKIFVIFFLKKKHNVEVCSFSKIKHLNHLNINIKLIFLKLTLIYSPHLYLLK